MIQKLFELLGAAKTAVAAGTIPTQSFPLPDPLRGLSCSSGATGLVCVVEKLADFLLIIGAPLVAIMVLVGGFYMVTSGGDPEKFTTGRKTILYAAIGFVVILLAKGAAAVIQNIFT